MSPSPVQSTVTLARIASRPSLLSKIMPPTRPSIVTAPFWALTGTPPYYYAIMGSPYFPPPAYNAPEYHPPAAPAHSPAASYTPRPTYKRSGGNIARQLNQQELNRLQAAPINSPPLRY